MVLAESPHAMKTPSVLIVAFRRWENVAQILETCQESGISRIYVGLDAPPANDKEAQSDHEKIKRVIADHESTWGTKIRTRIPEQNQGCAVNLILSCDWAFADENYIAILEDDCIPSRGFFEFCCAQCGNLDEENLWLVCGTQFAPQRITSNVSAISTYALTWGWATNRRKWNEIRKIFFEPSKNMILRELLSRTPEQSFWIAGEHRALRGFTDVWDTILVSQMRERGKFAILPPVNLISNVGNDEYSLHTASDSPWTCRSVSNEIRVSSQDPTLNSALEKWLVKHFFRIRRRHLFSTKMTLILDLAFRKSRRRFKRSLLARLKSP